VLCLVRTWGVASAACHRNSAPTPEHADLYRGRRFPREVIAHAVRLYLRFALSFVLQILDVSYSDT
jgi:hypothetical protein